MKHDKDPRASIYTELIKIDVAPETLKGPVTVTMVEALNLQPIHPTTVADVREHAYKIRAIIAAECREATPDEADALEMCRAVERWLCDRMGFYGEYKL